MKKTWWALTLLCTSQQTTPVFEGCHDRMVKYTVLAIITGQNTQKPLVLDFDHRDEQPVDNHALAHQCALRGYEFIEATHIKLIQRPVPITGPWGTFTSMRTHCKALVTVKPLCITRPIVLEFARRHALLDDEKNETIKAWVHQECCLRNYNLIEIKNVHRVSWHWRDFPEKYEYLLP